MREFPTDDSWGGGESISFQPINSFGSKGNRNASKSVTINCLLCLRVVGGLAIIVQIALITLVWCCCPTSSANDRNDLMQSKLLEMIQMNNRLLFERQVRSNNDLRDHHLFTSDPHLDCCPTVTELVHRKIGVSPQGLVLDLFHGENFTQTFYERACHPEIKDRPCQFLDPKFEPASRCVQQFSYVYAMARTYGNWFEGFRIDYVRVATGCKCQVNPDVINYSDEYGNHV
ncbi:hypothetical protein CAPTEDRAFT_203847 [Capitella teleta]|uniref:Spaetzle domain-containing protein n=1 Tax=Capitella teleta TaxID=283909 RepID=R7TIJ7_CAPTE|nr:hypothetical protein CAPTEDRAFT_203847 [Capitella teleta]|eukprot:ELT90905.1 hypothetical protein CAPTEDRAFT_203847 [Capitella teleta]